MSIGIYDSGESALSWLLQCFMAMGDSPSPSWQAIELTVESFLEWPILPLPLDMPLTSLSDLPRPFGCTLFLCLNFSSQLALLALKWLSEMPRLVAKNLAFSRIITSVNVMPCFLVFFAHTDNARSMSGNLPLLRLTGDLLPSSGKRYFSFCRRTLDTVLQFFPRVSWGARFVRWSKTQSIVTRLFVYLPPFNAKHRFY